MPDPIIIGKDIHKTYRSGKIQLHALRGVNLEVQAGEMVAVMGPSGCGKSTLLNCLSGLDQFDSGEVVIEGTSLRQMNDKDRTRYRAQRMGFVFQTFNLLPRYTALENVTLPLIYAGVPRHEREDHAVKTLDLVGLGDRMTHKPNELSGGQRQRVAIARALINNPSIILADEPTGNLDSKTSYDIMGLLDKIHEDGNTVIVVTHEEDIARHAHRIIKLMDGEVSADYINENRIEVRKK